MVWLAMGTHFWLLPNMMSEEVGSLVWPFAPLFCNL
jgi:hypothetical protein